MKNLMNAGAVVAATAINHTPHKSTTHEERYYHIRNEEATVFFRKEDDGKWYATVSLCHFRDQFCRRTGRNVARRKYFQKPHTRYEVEAPSYEGAEEVVARAGNDWVKRNVGDFADSLIAALR